MNLQQHFIMILFLFTQAFAITEKQQHVLLMGTSCAGKTSVANAFAVHHPVEVFQIDQAAQTLNRLTNTDKFNFNSEMMAIQSSENQEILKKQGERLKNDQPITVSREVSNLVTEMHGKSVRILQKYWAKIIAKSSRNTIIDDTRLPPPELERIITTKVMLYTKIQHLGDNAHRRAFTDPRDVVDVFEQYIPHYEINTDPSDALELLSYNKFRNILMAFPMPSLQRMKDGYALILYARTGIQDPHLQYESKKRHLQQKYIDYVWEELTKNRCRNQNQVCYVHLKDKSKEFTPVLSRDEEGNCLSKNAIVDKIIAKTGLRFAPGPFQHQSHSGSLALSLFALACTLAMLF